VGENAFLGLVAIAAKVVETGPAVFSDLALEMAGK